MINSFGETKRAQISRRKFDTIFDCFVADIPSSKAAIIAHVNRNTSDRYYKIFRELCSSIGRER